ncbi:MAG: VOC family protein [Actinomycetota bacterium]|nr:VOC family protein [Actinomycetota bacterium]
MYQAGWSTAARRARLAVTSDVMAAARVGHFMRGLLGWVVLLVSTLSAGGVYARGRMVEVRWVTGLLDSPSVDVEGFWVAVTGTVLSPRRGDFATLVPAAGDACLRVQVVRGAPPRAHVDLHVDDVGAAAAEVVGLGASAGREYCVTGRSPWVC